jgi:hypothetical protein
MNSAPITLLAAMSQAGIAKNRKGVYGSKLAGSGKVEFFVSQVRVFTYATRERNKRTPTL